MNGLRLSPASAFGLILTCLILHGMAVVAGAQIPTASPSPSDEATGRNALYFELLGNGGLYSVNYERRVRERVALRVGAGTWDATDLLASGGETERIVTVPMTASLLPQGRRGGLEVGGGLVVGRESSTTLPSERILALTGILGYRRSAADSSFLFRATLNPFLDLSGSDSPYPDEGFMLSLGVSLGGVF